MSTYAFSPLKKKIANCKSDDQRFLLHFPSSLYPKRGAGTGEATASPEFRAFTTEKF